MDGRLTQRTRSCLLHLPCYSHGSLAPHLLGMLYCAWCGYFNGTCTHIHTPPAHLIDRCSFADEERYATQISQLESMGFSNKDSNLRALKATSGNVNAAVERLLSGTF